MAAKNIELKVGLLVIIGAAILAGAVWMAKGYRYGQEFYSVSVVFPEVGALASGDPVAVSGVNKGKVTGLELSQGGVRVTMDLSRDVVLKEDASFLVKNIGLMGERFVAVKTGRSDVPLDLTETPTGAFDAGIPEVMGMMGEIIENLNRLVGLLEETVASPSTLDKFSEAIANLHKLSDRLEIAAEVNVPKVDTAIENFTVLSKTLKEGLDRNQVFLDTALQNFDQASRRLITLVSDLETASTKFKNFAVELEESEGSLRMLMEDRRLYDDIRKTAHNIDSLVSDIRQDPRKYINLTVELF